MGQLQSGWVVYCVCVGCVWIQYGNTAVIPQSAPVQTLLQAHPHYLGIRHDRPDKMAIV